MFTFLNKKSLVAVALGVLIAMACSPQANAEATVLKSFGNGYMDLAYDGEKFYRCFTESSEGRVTILDENFNVVETISLKDKLEGGRITSMFVSQFDTGDIVVSKGLFTNDGKWCVVVENSAYNYAVYTSDGKKIIDSLATDEGDVGFVWLANIYSGKPYYVTRVSGGKNYDYCVWSFTGNSGTGVTAQIANKVAAYPNPLPAGAPLTITLPKEADNHTIVTVADMNGRQVLRREIDKLATEVRISSRFAHGAYIYTIIYSDGTSYSGKVAAE